MPKNNYLLKTIGVWSWKPELLHKKIEQGPDDECWRWLGSISPHANLFGARKNNRAQMTQAARIIYMDRTGKDIEDIEIRHSCGNRFCCNWNHFVAIPNHMRYHKTGELLGTKLVPIKEPEPAPPLLGRIQTLTDREWWEI
jgi:hypothetical protein